MAMSVTITLDDVGHAYTHASGSYSPDVMHDITARAMDAATHAARLYIEIARTHIDGHAAPPAESDKDEVAE